MRVPMSANLIYQIRTNVSRMYEKERASLELALPVPVGVSDALYNMVCPLENEQRIREAAPGNAFETSVGVSINVTRNTTDNSLSRVFSPRADGRMATQRIIFPRPITVYSAQGIAKLTYNRGTFTIIPASDGTKIADPAVRDLVEAMATRFDKHKNITDEARKAEEDISKYLGQHKTLQSAVKDFPALMEYVPDRVKEVYNQASKKETDAAPAKEKVDIGYLAVKATLNKLDMAPTGGNANGPAAKAGMTLNASWTSP